MSALMAAGADYPKGRIEALVEAWADVQTEGLMMRMMGSPLATWLAGRRLHHPSCPARFTGKLDDCMGCRP